MTTTSRDGRCHGPRRRVIGPVDDESVDAMPDIYNALHVEVADPADAGEKKTLTLEVAQHLGDGLVRRSPCSPRQLVHQAAVTDTGTGITVPVGDWPRVRSSTPSVRC